MGAPQWNDKLLHAIGFALSAGLSARALRFLRAGASHGAIARSAFLVALGLGGLLELWQALLPWRSAELLDFVADGIGAALAAGAYFWVARRGTPKAALS